MRRVAFVFAILLIAGCGREKVQPQRAPSTAPSSHPATPAPRPAAAARKIDRSTPKKCAADGSYEQAVACFRQRAHLSFTYDRGSGDMTRSTPGAESLKVRVSSGPDAGAWTASTTKSGVVWSRDGKHVTGVPTDLERLFQRMTLFPDPQKKEGAPRLAATDNLEGEACNRYEFTDANTGDPYSVWVSRSDGRIVKARIGKTTLTMREG